ALAAVAGNMACRSSVAVKTMLMMSSWWTALRSIISRRSSWTRSSICSVVSASTVVAPRNARTAGGTYWNLVLTRVPAVGRGKREAHDRAPVAAWLGPDLSAVPLDHLLADGEADAAARATLGAAASVEHGEDRTGLVRSQSGPVVGDAELPLAGAPFGADGHLERSISRAVLHRVADEILEQAREL